MDCCEWRLIPVIVVCLSYLTLVDAVCLHLDSDWHGEPPQVYSQTRALTDGVADMVKVFGLASYEGGPMFIRLVA